jgi:hypothetical protein
MRAHHVRGHAGLIDERQPARVEAVHPFDEGRPLGPDLPPVPLGGA